MATVCNAFLARNRRFDVGEVVPDDDPLVAEYPALFGIEPDDDYDDDYDDDPEGDD